MSVNPAPAPRLCDVVSRVYVVKYREDTRALEEALRSAGLHCETVSRAYTPEEMTYTSIARGLLTHCEAWKRIAEGEELALVVEADFVPCRGFHLRTLPHPRPEQVWCWLYTGTSIAYELVDGCFMRGHAASPVATVISPRLAEDLLAFARQELAACDPRDYLPWDSYADYRLRKQGWQSYLAYRSFGEHGGEADRIHAQNRLSASHRADCLYGPLAFLPLYAGGSVLRFLRIRAAGKLKAWARLLLMRRIDRGTFRSLVRNGVALYPFLRYEVGRLLTWY